MRHIFEAYIPSGKHCNGCDYLCTNVLGDLYCFLAEKAMFLSRDDEVGDGLKHDSCPFPHHEPLEDESASEKAWRKRFEEMSALELKIHRNKTSQRQEEELVRNELSRNNIAHRIAKKYDVLVITKGGEMWLIDCKFSDSSEFWIEAYDIDKLLDCVAEYENKLPIGMTIKARVDMWFPRTRKKNNRRYVDITEADRGWTVRCTKTPERISTKRVKRGDSEERSQ